MGGLGNVLAYGAIELLAYAGWSWLALRLTRRSGLLGRAVAMGVLRWLMGLVLGAVIFLAVHPAQAHVATLYVAVYVPVRALEWFMLSVWVLPMGVCWKPRRRLGWIVGGIALSFLTDVVSPAMIEEARFCVGRCLCWADARKLTALAS